MKFPPSIILVLALSSTGCSEIADNVLSAPVQTVRTDADVPKARGKSVRLGDLCPKVGLQAITDKGIRVKCVPRDGFKPRWKKYL